MTDTNTDMSANIDIIRKAIESKTDGHLQAAQDHIKNLGEQREASLDANFDAYATKIDAELAAIEDDLRSSNARLNDQRSSSSLQSAELAPDARRLEALLATVENARGGDDE